MAELLWVQNLVEIQVPLQVTPIIYRDNMSAMLLTANSILHSKSKHFEPDLHFVRDHVAKGLVQISHVPTHAQVADVLTKPVSSAFFHEFCSKLKIVDVQSLSLREDVKDKQVSGVS